MNQLMEIPLHAGPEMERAINRTDFFRLFNSVCHTSGFEHFLLVQQVDRGARFDPVSSFLMTTLADQGRSALARALTEDKGAIFTRMLNSATPFTSDLSLAAMVDEAVPSSGHCLLALPLHSPDFKRYWLLLDGRRAAPGRRELADLMFDCLRIFSRFHEKILATDASGQLTGREIEVVRWTGEGKTSAEIAIILGLSEHTVISHITSAARKLNAVNRVHMIAIALRRGIMN